VQGRLDTIAPDLPESPAAVNCSKHGVKSCPRTALHCWPL